MTVLLFLFVVVVCMLSLDVDGWLLGGVGDCLVLVDDWFIVDFGIFELLLVEGFGIFFIIGIFIFFFVFGIRILFVDLLLLGV